MNYPRVTIAMAVYKPNKVWLREQLYSLNKQVYSGELELLIWNDSPNEFDGDNFFSRENLSIEWKLLNAKQKVGATKAFEILTEISTGTYIAYCDQDDIWYENKIINGIKKFQEKKSLDIVHCNAVFFYEENGKRKEKKLFSDLYQINERDYQKKKFVRNNWTLGCAMLVKRDFALKCLPFCETIFHDQWLAVCAAFFGEMEFINSVDIQHRIHRMNNSGQLMGVYSKKDYYAYKILKDKVFIHQLCKKIFLKEEYYWVNAREAWYTDQSMRCFICMMRYVYIRIDVSLFELLMPLIPNRCFSNLVKMITRRKNK